MIKSKSLLFVFILIGFTSAAQKKITGTVTDEDKLPIANVNVKSADGTRTQTDSVGYFTIETKSLNTSITISFTGYKTQQRALVASQYLNLSIILEKETKELNEVIISTGYQNIPRERSTGAFTNINSKKLNEQVSTDLLSRLEAIANGISVDRLTLSAKNNISIRGQSTISGPSGALIIVDNFPYEGDLFNINPNDIENITILKDAAAASIWGARAGNGVIVITTKKGKLNQPLMIDFNSNVSIDKESNLSYQRKLSSSEYIEFERYKFSLNYKLADTSNRNRPLFSPVYEILLQEKNKRISQEQANAMLSELARNDLKQQYQKYAYKSGVRQQYALNLNGGTTNSTWYFNAGYDNNLSELGAGYNRLNLNFRNSYKLLKNLTMNIGLSYTQSKSTSGRQGLDNEIEPYARLADENGSALGITRAYRTTYLDTLGNGKLLDWKYYPLGEGKYQSDKMQLNSSILNAGLNYNPLKWLGFEIRYQYEKQINDQNILYDQNSYFTRNLINQYAQLVPNQSTKFIVPLGGILDINENKLNVHNVRAQLNISQTWDKHEIYGLAGMELRERISDGYSLRRYGYDPTLNSYIKHDALNTYPNIVTSAKSLIPSNDTFVDGDNRFLSTFANAGYTYDKRYTVTLSARKDASNLFGLNTNDKWNLLWSAGGSWNVSNERFYNFEPLPDLKLRTTYGYSGNVDPSKSAVTTIIYSIPTDYTNAEQAGISQYANPELRWEKVRMLNLAMDFKLRGERVYGSVDFYLKNATDLYGPSELDYTTGAGTSITKNVASLKGHGLDIDITSLNIDRKFKWQSNFILTFYKDKVSKYYLPTSFTAATLVTGTMPNFNRIVGKPLYSMYSYKWGGLDPANGNPVGYLNGSLSQDWRGIANSKNFDELIYSGSAIPTIYGALGNTFSYKNFSLTARIMYKFGYYFRRESINYALMLTTPRETNSDYLLRWQKAGDELITNIPSFVYPIVSSRESIYTSSEQTVEKGDHIRLQYVNVDYQWDKNSLAGLPFKTLNIYFNINNIGILWRANKSGIDPSYPQSTIPPSRSISIGLRTTF